MAASVSGSPITRTCSSTNAPTTCGADYIKRKIRNTVKDPGRSRKADPQGLRLRHQAPTATIRTTTETFNKENVQPHRRPPPTARSKLSRPTGIRAGGQEYPCDIIVFATGFDAMTGPLKALNLKGRGGRTLDDEWSDGPHSYLGIAVAGFPNLFTITGPQSPSVLSNMPVSIEQHVEWITDCIETMRKAGKSTIEATRQAQKEWVGHVKRGRQHDADDRHEFLVHERQHSRQAPRFPAVPGSRGRGRVSERSATRWLQAATRVSNSPEHAGGAARRPPFRERGVRQRGRQQLLLARCPRPL